MCIRDSYEGKTHHFEGKKREQWHPFDRKDGTGRGRGQHKGGHGWGNTGTVKDEVREGEEIPQTEVDKVVTAEEEKTEDVPAEQTTTVEAV
jgi:hypothetical protein